MATLTYASTTITLPDDLAWPDEFAWQAVQQVTRYTIFGALRVEAAPKLAGRSITLQGAANAAWVQRSVLNTLLAWKALPGQQFTLVFRGTTYTVVFDHERGAIDAEPVVDYSDPVDDDFYVVTLRFLKV